MAKIKLFIKSDPTDVSSNEWADLTIEEIHAARKHIERYLPKTAMDLCVELDTETGVATLVEHDDYDEE